MGLGGVHLDDESRMRHARVGAVLALLLTMTACERIGETLFTDRTPDDYFIPDGFVGWVEIRYGVPNAPPLPNDYGRYQVRFGPSGHIATSTKFEGGTAHDRYYFYSARGVREISESEYIRAGAVGSSDTPGDFTREKFFVGTERQYWKAIGDPRGD